MDIKKITEEEEKKQQQQKKKKKKEKNNMIIPRWEAFVWKESWGGLFVVIDLSTSSAEVIFRIKWQLEIKTDSVQSSSSYLQKLFTKNLLTAH